MNYKKLSIIAMTVCIVTAVVYLPALDNSFVNWDDPDYVYNNLEIKKSGIDRIAWAFSSFSNGNWHPLTWISLSIDYALWDLNPYGFHLSNILFHSLNTLIVILLAGMLFRNATGKLDSSVYYAAFLVGLFFGIHPLHVESVVWISERKDVLYAFFFLLSILFYIHYLSSTADRKKAMYYILCLSFFLFSLLSKPMAVTLPAVLLILDFYPFKRIGCEKSSLRTIILEKTPFFLFSLASSVVTIIAQNRGGSMEANYYISLWERLLGAMKAIVLYLLKTIWPVNLVPLYPLSLDISPLRWDYFGSMLCLLCLSIVVIKLWKRTPVLIAAWTYYLVSLLPVLGIIQVGSQAMADRYMYLPVLGPFIVLGALGAKMWHINNKARYVSLIVTFLLAIIMSLLTVKQISVWQNSVTLWEYVVSNTSDSHKAYFNLGNAYKTKGDFENAERAWKKTVEIAPDHSYALNQLGNIYIMSNSLAEAKKYFLASIMADNKNAEAHYNLAYVLERLNELNEAHKHYEIFIEIAPPQYAHLFPAIKKKLSAIKAQGRN